jgi:NAD(P)-dependent dehydrogenase (short-subunit alcohol dehydrogenase family)
MELTEGIGALVAGGASGLGEATARARGARGAWVTIADLNAERGGALATELGGQFVEADVTDETQVRAAVESAG